MLVFINNKLNLFSFGLWFWLISRWLKYGLNLSRCLRNLFLLMVFNLVQKFLLDQRRQLCEIWVLLFELLHASQALTLIGLKGWAREGECGWAQVRVFESVACQLEVDSFQVTQTNLVGHHSFVLAVVAFQQLSLYLLHSFLLLVRWYAHERDYLT